METADKIMPENDKSEKIEPARPAEHIAREFFANLATVRTALEAGQIGVWWTSPTK